MRPLITIIIPVYNAEDYIGDCIQSLYAQTYSNWEAVIIDDGSADHTKELVMSYSKQDQKVKVLSQSNQGVSVARNYGLDQAKGEYIVFLDSDDMLHPDFLQKTLERMLEKQADIVSCRYIKIDSDKMKDESEKITITNCSEQWQSYVGEDALCCFHIIPDTYLKIVACKLIRKEVIGNLRFEQEIALGEDTLFMYELMLKGIRLEQTDACWYFYRMHEKSAVHNWKHMSQKDPYRVFTLIRDREFQRGRYDYAKIWETSYLEMLVIKYKLAKANGQREVCKNLRREAGKAMMYKGFTRSRVMYFLIFYCEPLQKICVDIINCIRERK